MPRAGTGLHCPTISRRGGEVVGKRHLRRFGWEVVWREDLGGRARGIPGRLLLHGRGL